MKTEKIHHICIESSKLGKQLVADKLFDLTLYRELRETILG